MSIFKPGKSLFGGTSAVTVVQGNVSSNFARNAKIGFWLTAVLLGLLTAAIAASDWHPMVALLLGMLVGGCAGMVVWCAVRAWPALRVAWWWATEIVLGLVFAYSFAVLAQVTSLLMRLLVLAVVFGVPAAIGPVRRFVVALAWCVIVRHRLRVCFSDVIKSNQHGSLPLILWARPTLVGERVWIFLRPGLSKTDIVNGLERLAVVCWATTVAVEQPGANSAFLRLDVKRREVLTSMVVSPLVGLVRHVKVNGGAGVPTTAKVPIARENLNLVDVPLVKYIPSSLKPGKPGADKPGADKPATPSTAVNGRVAAGSDTSNIEDWI